MKLTIRVTLLLAVFGLIAAGARPIPRDARIYIEPMPNDFDVYLKAEIIKKEIPVVVVSNPEAADYLLGGTAQGREKTDWHEGWLTAPKDKYTGAVELVNARGELVWAAEAGDRSLWFPALKRGGARKAADRIASQMKKAVGSMSDRRSRTRDWWQDAERPSAGKAPIPSEPAKMQPTQPTEPEKNSLAQCLSFDDLHSSILDDTGGYWTVEWKAQVINGCAESFRVEVVFTAYDKAKNRLEEAAQLVLVTGQSVTLVETKMAIEASKGKSMALEGVGLRTAP